MRSKEQNAKRYFAAIGSIMALAVTAASIVMLVIPGPTPEWVLIIFTALTAVASAVIGFLFGVTLPHARQLDREEAEKAAEHVDDYLLEG